MYRTQPASLENLRERIVNECRQINRPMLRNVRERFKQNLYQCMDNGDNQFQHLVNYEIRKDLTRSILKCTFVK